MVGVRGFSLTAEDIDLLQRPAVGGVILFSRNYESREQLTALTTEIHSLRRPPLLIAVDHEGGRVQRFRSGFTRLPAARRFGEIYETEPARAVQLAELCGWVMASELGAVGVDFSFAPVLDLDFGVSSVIGDRAFHRNPAVVATLARAYVGGMSAAGMAATGKHFPGHGGVETDSHHAVAVDRRSLAELERDDLVTFERLIASGLAGVMPAHVIYPSIDAHPAGFSSFWLQEVLRGKLRFQGLIFSDDLEMEGASAGGDIGQRARAALGAGCDMVLACNDFDKMIAVVRSCAGEDPAASLLRRVRMHGKHSITWQKLCKNTKWKQSVAELSKLIS